MANSYYPILCGTCAYWRREGERSDATMGQQPGTCTKMRVPASRTDWCKSPEEARQHEAAMAAYVAKSERYAMADRGRNRDGQRDAS